MKRVFYWINVYAPAMYGGIFGVAIGDLLTKGDYRMILIMTFILILFINRLANNHHKTHDNP